MLDRMSLSIKNQWFDDENRAYIYFSSPVNGIHVAAGRTEAGMTAEGDKFEISAGRAGIHGAAKRGVAAMDHFFYIFNDRVTGMLDIEHFFKMVCKNFL